MRATVCLPTYNERENLPRMIDALAGVLRDGDRVLVIDDNSPDGTGRIADELAAQHGFVDVLHRESKEGLGRAYIAGFHRALADGAELILEMDCDFSHDPADVPRLIAAAEGGADLVLGSRYVPGGGTRNWGLVRRLISKAARSTRRSSCTWASRTRPAASSAFAVSCSRRSTSTASRRAGTRSRSR